VRDSIRLPGTSFPIQDVGTVEEGQVSVREPVQTLDASQKVVVSQGVGAVQDFPLGPARDLTLDRGVRQTLHLFSVGKSQILRQASGVNANILHSLIQASEILHYFRS